jgi:hypothetical protein
MTNQFVSKPLNTLKGRVVVVAISLSLALTSAALGTASSVARTDGMIAGSGRTEHARCVAGGSTSDDDSIATGGAVGPCFGADLPAS